MRAIFGNDTALPEQSALTPKHAHPIQTAEYFNPYPDQYLVTPIDIIDYNIDGLAKLLMYKDYVKAKIALSKGTINAESIVMEELEKYPYKRKEKFVPPNFSSKILSINSEIEFQAALTDGGICQVLNGESLGK